MPFVHTGRTSASALYNILRSFLRLKNSLGLQISSILQTYLFGKSFEKWNILNSSETRVGKIPRVVVGAFVVAVVVANFAVVCVVVASVVPSKQGKYLFKMKTFSKDHIGSGLLYRFARHMSIPLGSYGVILDFALIERLGITRNVFEKSTDWSHTLEWL